jgi:glycopeptide antibiotics resistance protein
VGFDRGFLVLPFLVTILIYMVCWLSARKKRSAWLAVFDLAFLAYCCFAVGLLYFPLTIMRNNWYTWFTPSINWIPFKVAYDAIRFAPTRQDLLNNILNPVANFLLFMPMAAYLSLRFPAQGQRGFRQLMACALLAEPVQLLLVILLGNWRTIDIDDFIFNTAGALLAWAMLRRYRLAHR